MLGGFSSCAGNCPICHHHYQPYNCLAGHDDDHFSLASKETLINELDNYGPKLYGYNLIIKTLKREYDYDYEQNSCES